jgi:hypothetical protein
VYSLYILLWCLSGMCSISPHCVYSLYILLWCLSPAVSLCTVYSLYIYGCLSTMLAVNSLYNYSVLSAVSALPCLCSVLHSIQRAPTCAQPPCRRVGDEPQLCPVQYLLHSLLIGVRPLAECCHLSALEMIGNATVVSVWQSS